MKIAIVTTTYFPESNGASIRTEGIAEGLHAWGHKVIILVPGKVYSKEQGKYATVYHIPLKKSRIANILEKYAKFNKARYRALMKYAPKILKEEQVEIIHTRQPLDLFLIGKKMKEELNIHWVAEAHKLLSITDFENKLIGKKRYERILKKERKLLNQADWVVTMTQAGKQTLEEKGIQRPIIPVANASSIKPQKTGDFKFEKDKKYLLYAGSIREVEAVEELIAKFAEINKEAPETRLLIIGKGNINDLRQLAKNLGIASAVNFLGEIPFERMGYFYTTATLFVHLRPDITYHKDIIGLKFYDAIKCGLPIVVSEVGQLGDWIKREKFGKTFSLHQREGFQTVVKNMLKNKKQYREIKKSAERIGRQINWKKSCKPLQKKIGSL